MAIYPTAEQFQELMKGPQDQPVVMLNLLRFKPQADASYEGDSGLQAYMRYGEEMRKFVESKGGRFVWAGRVDSQLIGEGGEEFHVVALVGGVSPRLEPQQVEHYDGLVLRAFHQLLELFRCWVNRHGGASSRVVRLRARHSTDMALAVSTI